MKKETLFYKGYSASLHFSVEDSIMYGQVEGIRDVITFEFDKVSEAQSKFEEAIEDYFLFCEETNTDPEKPEIEVEFSVEMKEQNEMDFVSQPEEAVWSSEYYFTEMGAAA